MYRRRIVVVHDINEDENNLLTQVLKECFPNDWIFTPKYSFKKDVIDICDFVIDLLDPDLVIGKGIGGLISFYYGEVFMRRALSINPLFNPSENLKKR